MPTSKQVAANHENGQHSTELRTPECKAASSQNHKTLGLSAADPVLPHEDRSQFDALLARYTSEWTPVTAHQEFLVAQMTGARWKLQRLERIEVAMFAALESPGDAATTEAMMAQGFLDKDTSAGFARLDRYRASLERTYHRCARELRAAQKDEKQNEAKSRQIADKAICDHLRAINEGPLPPAILEAQAELHRAWAARMAGNKNSQRQPPGK